jgi:hypothetical protein
MFNLACDVRKITEQDLLSLIRCPDCAERLSGAEDPRPGKKGSTLYRLAVTLSRLEGSDDRSRDEQAYVRWVLKTKAERLIRAYAEEYATLPHYSDPGLRDSPVLPLPAPVVNRSGQLICGLPIDCCGKRREADRFLTVQGEVVGICAKAAAIFFRTFRELGEDESYRRLLSSKDRKKAESFARYWLGLRRDD